MTYVDGYVVPVLKSKLHEAEEDRGRQSAAAEDYDPPQENQQKQPKQSIQGTDSRQHEGDRQGFSTPGTTRDESRTE